MARSRDFPRGGVRSTSHRQTGWTAGPGGTVLTAITASGVGFIGDSLLVDVDGFTLVRTRGLFTFLLTAAAAAGDGYVGAFGIGIASLAAVIAGIGSVPTPLAEQNSENWLYWTVISAHAGVVGGVVDVGPAQSQRIEVDSKAMRKFTEEQAMYAVFEVVEEGAATADMWFDSRMLFKLP